MRYQLRSTLLRVRVFFQSRDQFAGMTFVYQAAEDKPYDSCRIGSRVPWFDVRLRHCTVGHSKLDLAKIKIYRLPHYVTLHYKNVSSCSVNNSTWNGHHIVLIPYYNFVLFNFRSFRISIF